MGGALERVQIFSFVEGLAETCVHFDAAHLSINLVSEIAVPMFPTLKEINITSF